MYHGVNFFLHMITSGLMTSVSGLQSSLTIIYVVETPGAHTLEALKAYRKVLRITIIKPGMRRPAAGTHLVS